MATNLKSYVSDHPDAVTFAIVGRGHRIGVERILTEEGVAVESKETVLTDSEEQSTKAGEDDAAMVTFTVRLQIMNDFLKRENRKPEYNGMQIIARRLEAIYR